MSATGQGALGALSWASSSEKDLQQLIKAQRDRYEAGVGLSSLGAEALPSAMQGGAYDDTNAQLRAAFWLYVGARLLLAKGDVSKANAVASQAYKRYHAAQGGWVFNPAGSGKQKVETILGNAASIASQNGLPDIARILMSLASPEALQAASSARQEAHPISSLVDTGFSTLQSLAPQEGKKPWGLYLLGGGALLAVIMIAGRPYFQAAMALKGSGDERA